MSRIRVITTLVMFLALACPAVAEQRSTADRDAPRFLVHLLDYLAQDYAGAVQNGKVINRLEYEEQVEFSKAVLETAKKIPEVATSKDFYSGLDALKRAIDQKADPATVATKARWAQAQVLTLTKLEVSPTRWPSRKNGRKLFARDCASCHGAGGAGDGPGGVALDPKPSNFLDRGRMGTLSPFQAFNTIRLGVPGTGMAPFSGLSDQDVWDLAFYVLSLRHEGGSPGASHPPGDSELLRRVATESDVELGKRFSRDQTIALRLFEPNEASADSLAFARGALDSALAHYRAGRRSEARSQALAAYLEGIEPVEPRLNANDPGATAEIEERMAEVRSLIEKSAPLARVTESVVNAKAAIDRASRLLTSAEASPWVTFLVASGILLREGFEAFLILLALLGVVRAAGSRRAEKWIHGGWALAVALGVVAWFFSGWVMRLSGAGREMMEAVIAAVAVVVLLYLGFWLHRKTEITRWKAFLEGKVKKALEGGNLLGLAAFAFLAVFREAFETVLFLRAVWLESGSANQAALASGVFAALAVILLLAWWALRYSARIPVKRLFDVSSTLMVALAVILAGKSFHAFQEAGALPITLARPALRAELIGLYPTVETILAQVAVLALSLVLWFHEKGLKLVLSWPKRQKMPR